MTVRVKRHILLNGGRERLGFCAVSPNPCRFQDATKNAIVHVFFLAKSDINGKMTSFFVLPILQKLKRESFFHHKEFLKE